SFRDGKGPPSTVTATGYHSSPGSGSQAPFFKRSACFCLLFSHFLNSRSAKHTELPILNVTFGSSERQIQIVLPHWLQVSSCKIWYASRSMKSYGVQGSVGCSWKLMADGRMPAAIAALIFVMTWVLGGHVSAVTKNPRHPPCRSRSWRPAGSTGGGSDGPTRVAAGSRRERAPRRR